MILLGHTAKPSLGETVQAARPAAPSEGRVPRPVPAAPTGAVVRRHAAGLLRAIRPHTVVDESRAPDRVGHDAGQVPTPVATLDDEGPVAHNEVRGAGHAEDATAAREAKEEGATRPLRQDVAEVGAIVVDVADRLA